jgi:Transposase DDE domain
MSHAKALYLWEQRVATFFPELPPARRAGLALVSFGIVLARSALLNAVVLRLACALGQAFNTLRQRLRRFYRPCKGKDDADRSFDGTACFGPLLRWATAGFGDRRLALAIDPTNLGSRFTILTVSVVFGSCAVPVAWQVQRGDASGSWNEHWKRLLGLLHQALGDGWQVLVLSDRGLESKGLFEAIVQQGWHPLMRVKKAGHFRPDGWVKGWPLGRFAGHLGAHWVGRGVAWPTSSRLACTLLACWEAGHEDSWLVLTDLTPGSAWACWYAWRSWIEQGFRDLKSDGWKLSKTRMTDPERVARWWTAAALATLWVLESGQEARRLEVPATRTHLGREKPPVTSLFALGLAWLGAQVGRGSVRRLRRLPQPAWPPGPVDSDHLKEQDWLAEHQTVPL